MPTNPNRSFKGLADVYIKPYGVAGLARAVGSLAVCAITHQVQKLNEPNNGRDGGLATTLERLTGCGVNLTFQSISVPNLALMLRAGITEVASGTVSEADYTAYLGGLIRLQYMNPSTVVVTNSAGTTTYVNGTDYKVTGAGVIPLEGGAITEAQAIKISYAYSAQRIVQPFTQGQGEYTIYFDGLNEAENNANVTVDLHRVKLAIPQELSMIGDNFMRMAGTGDLLLDPTKTGVGVSKFYNWHEAVAA